MEIVQRFSDSQALYLTVFLPADNGWQQPHSAEVICCTLETALNGAIVPLRWSACLTEQRAGCKKGTLYATVGKVVE